MLKDRSVNRLAKCSDKEMVGYLSEAISYPDETIAMTTADVSQPACNPLLSKRMSQLAGLLRGMELWYHGAHHATRGASFAGDHVSIYGPFYDFLNDEVDSAIEKAVGLTNDEEMSCPQLVTALALQVICKYPSPVVLTSLALASTALQFEKDYIAFVEVIYKELEAAGCLSLGLNDMLASSANSHQDHIYKLQQRIKSELED